MKLRIRGNSLRLRLGKGEVARLGGGERVEEAIEFGAEGQARLVYAIVPSEAAIRIEASFIANEICVTLPIAMAVAWATGDDVSLEAEQSIGRGAILKILVEKDFACLKPRSDEDESDAYPNPSSADC